MDQPTERSIIATVVVIVAAMLALAWFQNQNQFAPPLPGPAPPVVPQLPDIAAALRHAKTTVESQASAAKRFLESSRRSGVRLEFKHGGELYGAHRADLDALIEFLVVAAQRGYQGADEEKVRRRLDQARSSYRAFYDWTQRIEPKYASGDPLAEVVESVWKFLQAVNHQNESVRRDVINRLDQCRPEPWDRL